MKKICIFIGHSSWLVFMLLMSCTITGCATGKATPIGNFMSCTTWVSNCNKKLDALQITIGENPDFPQVSKYRIIDNLWGDRQTAYNLYWNSNESIYNIEMPEIKGAKLIQTGAYDWNINKPNFLNIKLLNEIDAFYIGYDESAPKPEWLTSDYRQVLNPHTSKPYRINLGGKDNLEIWRRSTPIQGGEISIPGNVYKCGNCAGPLHMYIVLIKPKETTDCNNMQDLGRLEVSGCYQSLKEVDEAAARFCAKEYPAFICHDTTCDSQPDLCPKESGLTVEPRVYLKNSEIAFDPISYTSTADIAIAQNKFLNQAVRGSLEFEYQYETKSMKLNSMDLKIDPIITEYGMFKDISVKLWKTAEAQCKDTMPVYHQPCTLYEIPPGGLVVGLGARLDEKPFLFAGSNLNAMPVIIDHQTRTFTFQGPLVTTVELDGHDTPVSISVNLTGHFVNFAPKAFGRESTKKVECGMSRTNNQFISGNKIPVKLNSAGSFEVYDAFATNPPIYAWYEDFGLVTEKAWGAGPSVTIPPCALGYGVHRMTLLVKDHNGIVDTDTFDLEVIDTVPPELSAPKDIIFYHIQSGGISPKMKINLAKPQAWDSCAQEVMVSNDAPEDLLFAPGDTLVTWIAADGHGNVATKVQKVSVLPVKSLADFMFKNGQQVTDILKYQIKSIKECREGSDCLINLEEPLDRLGKIINEMKSVSVYEQLIPLRQQVINKLEQSSAYLKEADELSKRSRRMTRPERNSALKRVEKALGFVNESVHISRGLK